MKKKVVVSSLAFKFIERFLVKGLGLIVSIVLARQISPDDFGQMAILTVFINISLVLVQGGFNTALVQKKKVTDTDYSTAFCISLCISLFAVVVLFFATPFIAAYYQTDLIVLPLRVYSLSLIIGALSSIQTAKMQKEMRFKDMLIISLISTTISGTVGIIAAYARLGIWALIIYYLASNIVSCIVTCFFIRWFPKLVFSLESAKTLFSYGWKMLVSAILCSIYADVRSLIIGKKYSVEDLAYYNRGQQFPELFAMTLDTSVQSVMLPVFSEEQDRRDRMREILKKSITLSTFFVFPAMIGLCVVAEPLVLLLLTDTWLPCVVFMKIICIAEMSVPLASSNLIALKATGRSDIYMKLELIRRIVMIAVLLITVFCFDSVIAITIGFLISSVIDFVIISIPIKSILGYGLISQIKDIWKITLASVFMGVIVYVFMLMPMNPLAELILAILIGVCSYIGIGALLKIEVLNEAISFAYKFVNDRKSKKE